MSLAYLKHALIERGPSHPVTNFIAARYAWLKGTRLRLNGCHIEITRYKRKILLSEDELPMLRFVIDRFASWFELIEAREIGGFFVLDFSRPGLHHYRGLGIDLYALSIPDEGDMSIYVRDRHPSRGDVVFDLGAHMGATTYALSRLVGPGGMVYAFEPDQKTHAALLKNIQLHSLNNTIPVSAAIAGGSGVRRFSGGGSLASGFAEYVAHPRDISEVSTMNLLGACEKFGVPAFVKMDIEGAEVEVIEASIDFLRAHPIDFAIECHGERIEWRLKRAFTRAGYSCRKFRTAGQDYIFASMILKEIFQAAVVGIE